MSVEIMRWQWCRFWFSLSAIISISARNEICEKGKLATDANARRGFLFQYSRRESVLSVVCRDGEKPSENRSDASFTTSCLATSLNYWNKPGERPGSARLVISTRFLLVFQGDERQRTRRGARRLWSKLTSLSFKLMSLVKPPCSRAEHVRLVDARTHRRKRQDT